MSLLEWEVLNSVDAQILSKLACIHRFLIDCGTDNQRYAGLLANAQKRYSVSINDEEENVRNAS